MCGHKYTCIRTDGCYLLLYGEIGKIHSKNSFSPRKSINLSTKLGPFTNPQLDSESVIQVLGFSNFIVVITESKQVFAFDSCMQLVPLQCFNYSVECIIGNEKAVWGVCEKKILE